MTDILKKMSIYKLSLKNKKDKVTFKKMLESELNNCKLELDYYLSKKNLKTQIKTVKMTVAYFESLASQLY